MKIEFEFPVLTTARVGRTTKERFVVVADKGEFVVPEFSHNEIEHTVTWKEYGNEKRVIQVEGDIYQKVHEAYHLMDRKCAPYYFDFQGMSSRGPRHVKPQGHLEHTITQQIFRILRANQGSVGSVLATDELIGTVAGEIAVTGLKSRGDETFSKMADEPFEDAKEQMKEATENLLIIDGVFWQKCQTPMLWSGLAANAAIRHDVFTHPYFESIENIVTSHWNRPSIISEITRIGDNDEFLRSFLKSAGKEPGPYGRELASLDIRFDDAEMTTFDGTGHTLMHLVHSAIEEAGETLTKRVMPVQKLNAMSFVFAENLTDYGPEKLLELQRMLCALRDSYKSGEASEDLLTCVRRMQSHVLDQMDLQTTAGYSRAVINEAIARWDDRPVHVERAIHGFQAKPKM